MKLRRDTMAQARTGLVILYSAIIVFNKTLSLNFTTCELFMELRKQGFPQDQLSDWVCLIDAESSKRTDAVGGPDEDGSYDYGLFQINSHYWCNDGENPGKICNVTCSDLLDDDITEASICAKKIYMIQGFSAWLGWKKECTQKTATSTNC